MNLNYRLVAPYTVEGVANSSFEECLDYIKSIEEVGVDIETTRKFKGKYGKDEGLDPYLSSIVMIQVGDKNKQFVIDARFEDITLIKKLITLLATKKSVGHNLKFEYKHFLVNYGLRLERMHDTMITEQILMNGIKFIKGKPISFSLDSLNRRYLKVYVDKTTRLEFLHIANNKFTKRQIAYGAEDILYPMYIKDSQMESLKKENLLKCYELEMKFILCLGDIESKGLYFSKEVWTKAYNIALNEYKHMKEFLDNYVIEKYPAFTNKQLSLFSEGITCGIQWTSSKQVIKFFDSLGICPEAESKTTKKVSKTVEAKELQSVLTREDLQEEDRTLIKNYLKFKKCEQAITTFGIEFFKYIHPITGRIHSSYTQIKNTGRIASSAVNVQNIPSKLEYRQAFTAPVGYKMISVDYSGQESLVLVNKSLDTDLIYFYQQGGGDLHSFVASKIFPELSNLSQEEIKSKHKDKRQIAKVCNFALAYGGLK